MRNLAKSWVELLEKERNKAEKTEKLKTQDTVIKDYNLNNFTPDKIGNWGSDNQEMIENQKENNQEQFRKSYTFLDNYIKDKLISGNTAYIYNYILNDYTVKKDYAKRYKKAIPKFYDFEFKKVIDALGFNFRTLKKALEELENVGILEIKKTNKFTIKITFKKPTIKEWEKS